MAKGCAEADLRRDLQEIADDPNSFWLGGGDYCDFIGYHDGKRFDPDVVAEWVSVADLGRLGRLGFEQILGLARPVRHKCLGMLLGNHELKYAIATEQQDIHGQLCADLDVPNLAFSAFFDLVFCQTPSVKSPVLMREPPQSGRPPARPTVRVFAHHRAGYAQTPGGKLNKLIQFMQSFDADLYFVGHVHDRVARREPALVANADCTKICERQRLGMISGSYLKTYTQGSTSYGEQRGYRPTALGAAVARITPATGHIEAVI